MFWTLIAIYFYMMVITTAAFMTKPIPGYSVLSDFGASALCGLLWPFTLGYAILVKYVVN